VLWSYSRYGNCTRYSNNGYSKSEDGTVTRLQTEESEVQIPVGTSDSSVPKIIQTGSGAHPASSAGTGIFFSGGRVAGTWCWPRTSHLLTRLRISRAITPLPGRRGVDRKNFMVISAPKYNHEGVMGVGARYDNSTRRRWMVYTLAFALKNWPVQAWP
jgi:hypothetical protein